MTSMQALILTPPTAAVKSLPIPSPSSSELLIRVRAIALNPVDALYVAHYIRESDKDEDRIVGSDFAGEVVQLGNETDPYIWKVGDRVAGFVQGVCSTNTRPGAFAQYLTIPASLAFHIPLGTTYEEAATLPLCALTAAQGIFLRLRIPAPFTHPHPVNSEIASFSPSPARKVILIYGASTSLGLYVLALARLLRNPTTNEPFVILGTASATNHELLRSRGIDGVVDYHDPLWPEQIRKLTPGGLGVHYAFDCISEGESTGKVSECFVKDEEELKSIGGGRVAVIRKEAWDAKLVRKDVLPLYGAVWSGLGEAVGYNGAVILADLDSFAFTEAFYAWLGSSSLPIDPNPVRMMPGGLERIPLDGFILLGAGLVGGRQDTLDDGDEKPWMRKISAEKMVYTID